MCQFIESICCVNRKLRNLDFHQRRFNETRRDNFTKSDFISLEEIINFPLELTNNKYKVRLVYDKEIRSIEFFSYKIKKIRTIRLFKIDEKVNYSYKYANRLFLDKYLKEINTDDLVLVKSDNITDCIYSNIVFFDGKQWITPKTFLLKGTMREFLLQTGEIVEQEIKVSDLKKFKSFKRINAMMNLNESQEIEISHLF